jgi:hypothetical protein
VFSWLLTLWGFYGSGQLEACSEYGVDSAVSIGGHCFCDVTSRSGGHIHYTATSGATLEILTEFCLLLYSCFYISANMGIVGYTTNHTGCLFTACNAFLQWRRSGRQMYPTLAFSPSGSLNADGYSFVVRLLRYCVL